MSDRCSVRLDILTTQVNPTLLNNFNNKNYGVYAEAKNENITSFVFYDVNYGDLSFLPELTQAGIAYNSNWENGGEYTSGSEYCRFTDTGSHILTTVYDNEINPDIHTLMKFIDQPILLRQCIIDHVNKCTPLPWDNQENYGKLYLAIHIT